MKEFLQVQNEPKMIQKLFIGSQIKQITQIFMVQNDYKQKAQSSTQLCYKQGSGKPIGKQREIMLHAIYEICFRFIYAETLTLSPSREMYQISVCRVKSKFASSFGFLSKTVAKIQQIFEFTKYRSIISDFLFILFELFGGKP